MNAIATTMRAPALHLVKRDITRHPPRVLNTRTFRKIVALNRVARQLRGLGVTIRRQSLSGDWPALPEEPVIEIVRGGLAASILRQLGTLSRSERYGVRGSTVIYWLRTPDDVVVTWSDA
ncbi:MAG: hypothetical protein ACK4KV_19160 [Rhodocyclaceae bacterium]